MTHSNKVEEFKKEIEKRFACKIRKSEMWKSDVIMTRALAKEDWCIGLGDIILFNENKEVIEINKQHALDILNDIHSFGGYQDADLPYVIFLRQPSGDYRHCFRDGPQSLKPYVGLPSSDSPDDVDIDSIPTDIVKIPVSEFKRFI